MNIADLKIHHIGVAVAKIDDVAKIYEDNGYTRCGNAYVDDLQKAVVCFLQKEDELTVELIEPASPDSPVATVVTQNADEPEVYYICYEVEDLEKTLADLETQQWKVVAPPATTTCACGNARVAMMHSDEAGLIKLLCHPRT